jgi:lipopolysaccharide/colanic/teichoic acid biosynthesis glycosyltransferase
MSTLGAVSARLVPLLRSHSRRRPSSSFGAYAACATRSADLRFVPGTTITTEPAIDLARAEPAEPQGDTGDDRPSRTVGKPWAIISIDDAARSPIAALADRIAKRAIETTVAAIVLLLSSPLTLATALAVKVSSRGPLLYRATRMGRGGRRIGVVKFRKMAHGTTGIPLTAADDARFTRIGRFLSATHIDELPQLWQVVTGQLSLIGPRPEDPQFVDLHPQVFRRILTVRPGLSGWTQLVFCDEKQLIDPSDAMRSYIDGLLPRKIALDRLYADHRRLVHDLKLMLWTPLVLGLHFEVHYDAQRREFRLGRRQPQPRPDIPLQRDGVDRTGLPEPRHPIPLEQT